MLPIPVWKWDAFGVIPMLCGGMNMPGGSIAGETWVLWLAERISVFADKLSQTGSREWEGVHPTPAESAEGPDKLPSGVATARSARCFPTSESKPQNRGFETPKSRLRKSNCHRCARFRWVYHNSSPTGGVPDQRHPKKIGYTIEICGTILMVNKGGIVLPNAEQQTCTASQPI
jgi:hypothetical protein